jgi:hypothetical protein
LLPASRVTGIVDRHLVLVQEEAALVRGQLIQDQLRIQWIVAFDWLGTHNGIVTLYG